MSKASQNWKIKF